MATAGKLRPARAARLTIGEIAERNRAGGFFFFSKSTLQFFGDTPASFKVAEGEDGQVWIYRVRAPRRAPAGYRWRPEWRTFNTTTGDIGTPHQVDGERRIPSTVKWARQ